MASLRSPRPAGLLLAALIAAGAATAWAQAAQVLVPPFDDAQARALAALDAAQATVDVAHYNIRNEAFFAKLDELRARGVRVRVVVDAKNARQPWNTLDDRFEAAGFAIRRYENTGHRYAIMHHKFTVIDGAVVMTGSYNWNETAQLANDENMLVLTDSALAAAYTEEFEELWQGGPDAPGRTTSGTAELLFAPEDDPRQRILELIRGAQRRVRVAMFSFRDRDVARALRDAARRGVEVTLVTERKQADGTNADETVAAGGGRVIVGANTTAPHSAMHQKFAIVDDEVVITGACNWSWTAFEHSNEDVLLLRDPAIVARYLRAHAALVHRYDPAGYDPAAYGLAQPEASVHVVVRCPFTGWGETVWLVGEGPELGSWDPAQGVALETTEGIYPTWTGRLRLPAGARRAYKAVIRGPAGDVWELGGDRLLEIDAAGTDAVVDVTFRRLVDVTLTATLAAPPPGGAELRLVGPDPALGAWDPQAAWPLTPDPADPARFHTTLPLPGRAQLPCKLVLVEADGTVTWEQGWDRLLAVHDQDTPQAVDLGPFRAPATTAATTSTATPAPTPSTASPTSTTGPGRP